MSWGSELLDTFSESCTRLPLLLCRGTPNTMKAVHTTISKMFDCIFVSLPANSEDLSWLIPIILSPGNGSDNAKPDEEVRLEYIIPGLPKSETITVTYKVENLSQLWIKCV